MTCESVRSSFLAAGRRYVKVKATSHWQVQGPGPSAEVVKTDDGIRYRLDDGRKFKSPSAAGSAVMGGKACNGWSSGASPRLRR
jgi:hypothetical protein